MLLQFIIDDVSKIFHIVLEWKSILSWLDFLTSLPYGVAAQAKQLPHGQRTWLESGNKKIAYRQLAVEAKKLPVGQHDVLTHNTSIFNRNTLGKWILPLLLFFCLNGKNGQVG
jgi:hypothetical protein